MTTAQALRHARRLDAAAKELRDAVRAIPFGDVVHVVGHVAIADAAKSPGHAETLAASLRAHAHKFGSASRG